MEYYELTESEDQWLMSLNAEISQCRDRVKLLIEEVIEQIDSSLASGAESRACALTRELAHLICDNHGYCGVWGQIFALCKKYRFCEGFRVAVIINLFEPFVEPDSADMLVSRVLLEQIHDSDLVDLIFSAFDREYFPQNLIATYINCGFESNEVESMKKFPFERLADYVRNCREWEDPFSPDSTPAPAG